MRSVLFTALMIPQVCSLHGMSLDCGNNTSTAWLIRTTRPQRTSAVPWSIIRQAKWRLALSFASTASFPNSASNLPQVEQSGFGATIAADICMSLHPCGSAVTHRALS